MTKNILLLFIFCINFSYGQQDTIMYLHSWKKPKKVEKITNDRYLNIKLVDLDSAFVGTGTTHYTGLLLTVSPTEITMTIDQEHLLTKRQNGSELKTSNYYRFPDSLKKITDGEVRTIQINKIDALGYFHEPRISTAGGFLAGISFVTALIIAPLVSINYKTGEFREHIYYPMLLGSAGGITLGLTLNIGTRKNKNYNIKVNSPDPCDNNYWWITNK